MNAFIHHFTFIMDPQFLSQLPQLLLSHSLQVFFGDHIVLGHREAELVVHLLLLGIAQDVVGFLDLLEAVLGGLVARVDVRMVLARQLSVRLLYLFLGGGSLNAQDFVEILVSVRHRLQHTP